MKLLKADSNQGFFLAHDGEYREIDKITKEDLLRLMRIVLNDDVEFDEFDEDVIKNQAHQVVYKSIYRNLLSLRGRKQEFVDESERLYLEDYKRYTKDVSQQGGFPGALTDAGDL
jgi:U3 small nucleolar RNA-associated protein 14